ncbi:MAG: hypothetical protein KGH93_00105 [Patescibacteria group bacterium]|nr:hypothetical protein [Patescibacteria group bacterium]
MKKNRLQDAFLAELRRLPIVQAAAEKLGVSRKSIYVWKQKDAAFAEAMDEALAEGEALINDYSEHQLISLIKEKSWPALAFWLKHRNAKFKDKVEVTAKIERDEKLTPEQEAVVRKALSLAAFSKDTNDKK